MWSFQDLRYNFSLFLFAKWRKIYNQHQFFKDFASIQFWTKKKNSLTNGFSDFKTKMCQLCKKIRARATLSTDTKGEGGGEGDQK